MFVKFRRYRAGFCITSMLVGGGLSVARADLMPQPAEQTPFSVSTTSTSWSTPPGNHHRLYFDVYNNTEYYDYETLGIPQLSDRTILADIIRPAATILWDERFRIQVGAIAEKVYGGDPEITDVDPWLQLLWKPTKDLGVFFGDLDIPHHYHPALFYETNYVQQVSPPPTFPAPVLASDVNQPPNRNHETGVQLILNKPTEYDDFFFNYFGIDTPSHNEQFDWGIVHRNEWWNFFRFNYQSHWRHEGGESNPHPINVINDVTQLVSGGLFYDVLPSLRIGGNIYYLHSHYRIDATDVTKDFQHNGNAQMYDAFASIKKRVRLIYTYWRGEEYFTKDGNPAYSLPRLIIITARWDILNSPDFNLLAEASNYFIGNNDQGVDHRIKPVFHVQASWQFSLPIMEWTSPSPSPEGPPVPPRWDYGL